VVSNENNTQSIVTAQTGIIETRERERYFVLSNGQRIEIKPDKNEFKLIEFETHTSKIDSIPTQLSSADAQSMQALALLAEPTSVNMGELGWRIGMAIAAFNLVILAIAIPFINPRSGRSGSLIVTVISFFTYYNLVNMSKYWVAGGKISLPAMLVTLHLPVLVVSLLVLYWRQQQGLVFAKPRKTVAVESVST
jgi:lipopolysaccharide export system permease protein